MLRTTLVALSILVASVSMAEDAPKKTPEQATLTEVGQIAPAFTLETVSGETFDLEAHRGKVVLVNFWATWCPPCIEEMPALRDRVHARFDDEDFAMICVAREEDNAKIGAFARKRDVAALPMAGDVDRTVYARYAEHTIPRNVVIDRSGRIVYQSFGFEAPEFEAMIARIERAIAADGGAGEESAGE